jgi:hypothetical protein
VPDGVVDQLDYQLWKANFGNTIGSGSATASQFLHRVPEPASAVLFVMAIRTLTPILSRNGGASTRRAAEISGPRDRRS